jgi:ACS family D-galactonate transporter-like MFS transporter
VLGIAAILIGVGMAVFFRGQGGEHEFRPAYAAALARLGAYAAIFLVAVVGIYFVATRAGLPEWAVALLELVVALLLVGFIFARLSGQISPLPCRDTPGARLDGSREESEGRCAHE